ncbi:unnamed protein product [Caenorhabditis brenneri]
MDSETDTDTISLCDSETSRENYKSPESSDCEGYATPLASSLTDISNAVNQGITIDVPEDVDMDSTLEAGERTPKPRILVMTQREIHEESSEDEFFDADIQIRNVAEQLLNGVEDAGMEITNEGEERADTPIMEVDTEEKEEETEEMVSEEEEQSSPVQSENEEADSFVIENSGSKLECPDEKIMSVVQDVTEEILSEIETFEEAVENTPIDSANGTEKEPAEKQATPEVCLDVHSTNLEEATCDMEDSTDQKADYQVADNLVSSSDLAAEESNLLENSSLSASNEDLEDAQTNVCESVLDCKNTFDNCENKAANNHSDEEIQKAQTPGEEDERMAAPTEKALMQVHVSELLEKQEVSNDFEKESDLVLNIASTEMKDSLDAVPVAELPGLTLDDNNVDSVEMTLTNKSEASILLFENGTHENAHQEAEEKQLKESETSDIADITLSENSEESAENRPVLLYEQMPEVFSEITIARTPAESIPSCEPLISSNQETFGDEPMTTIINSDEVKTSLTSPDIDMSSDCSPHEVKVDFDGYSSGKEESLSSSTSSESFEFAEPVSSNNAQDERTQALRNSIIERYPSNDTDEDDLDSVGDDFEEDLLAVKQISAEVEQLVAAINAFGRDEEQQMSAYLVGKKMAAEKKRKSAMDTGMMTSPCHDQTVQTDNDSFILVDQHLPVAMENLQVEIDKLQAELEKVRCGEKELLKINSQLKVELEESQQTIDGIEVEAEQQYTELTSEIDELCEIVQRKDQELANIKEKVANLSMSEINLKDDVESQKVIVQRQKEIIETLREDLDAITKKLGDVSKARDKAIEEATIYKMKNMERDRFLQREAQMSMEIEDLQRELNKQRLILNQTSMAKLADTFDRKVLHLENELRERDMLICKQNQIINSHRKSPTGSVITHRKMQPRASVLAAAGNLPSAGSSSESFQNGLDADAKEALLSFILSDRHNQLANIYNIGRILDLTPQEERSVERHLTKDRFA